MFLTHGRCIMLANDKVSWNEFDSESYFKANYDFVELRTDELQLIELVSEHFRFASSVEDGIDVGTGPNIYPALAMLPVCESITLLDYSEANLRWLEKELRDPSPAWQAYWDVLARESRYREISEPWAELRRRTTLTRGDVFELPRNRWDIGSMFFVAESITETPGEFEEATERFVGSLRGGAPFAAAFMERSAGYTVGDRRYPAVPVTVDDVAGCLRDRSARLEVDRIHISGEALREGYGGFILARGLATG